MRKAVLLLALMGLAVGFVVTAGFTATEPTLDNVQKMSVAGLKAQLGNPNIIIIDVRTVHDWESSKTMVKGAIREDIRFISNWIDKYPKDKTIVFYCK